MNQRFLIITKGEKPVYLVRLLFLEVIFVIFFLWRSLLEPEEVRAYPQALLVLMGLCALVSIWYAWKLRKSTTAPTDEIRFNKYFSIGLFFCYLLSFHTLGFLIATAAFYFIWMVVIDRRVKVSHVVISVVFAVLLYYVFHDVLGVLLPAGLLEGVLA